MGMLLAASQVCKSRQKKECDDIYRWWERQCAAGGRNIQTPAAGREAAVHST